jgi:medium-chain acyl-[acyl-carrier-protein] hydrolase
MNPIWETSFKITAFDVDANNRLRVSRVFDYFQDAASNDAERFGFGYNDFASLGLFWVLSWVKFEFVRYPKFMDALKIQTWAKKQYKLYSMRDFLMFNSKDEIIIRGTSAWLLLDSKSLRPRILTQLYPELKLLGSKDALPDLPQKINPVIEMEMIYIKKIHYSDIDLNQHTNNAKYVELMLDCFDHNFHKDHCVKSLTISFTAETKFGEDIELYKGNGNSNVPSHYIEAKNKISSNSVFHAAVEWY